MRVHHSLDLYADVRFLPVALIARKQPDVELGDPLFQRVVSNRVMKLRWVEANHDHADGAIAGQPQGITIVASSAGSSTSRTSGQVPLGVCGVNPRRARKRSEEHIGRALRRRCLARRVTTIGLVLGILLALLAHRASAAGLGSHGHERPRPTAAAGRAGTPTGHRHVGFIALVSLRRACSSR